MSDLIPDRRASDGQIRKLFAAVDDLKDKHTALDAKLDENTAATSRIEKNTKDIVEAWSAIAGGMKVLGWLGRVAKYVTYILAAVTAGSGAWYALTHWGQTPPIDIPK